MNDILETTLITSIVALLWIVLGICGLKNKNINNKETSIYFFFAIVFMFITIINFFNKEIYVIWPDNQKTRQIHMNYSIIKSNETKEIILIKDELAMQKLNLISDKKIKIILKDIWGDWKEYDVIFEGK
jgi:hypothetical protein